MWLFALFLGIPLIEISLFVTVGGAIGLWATLAIVLGTAILGTTMMRAQGALAMHQIRGAFNDMRDPTEPLAHGAMILLAGALLVTPGFFTDTLGLSLLLPPVRAAAFRWLRARVTVQSFGTPGANPRRPAGDTIIDGEFEEVPQPGLTQGGNSGWTRH